MSNDQGVKGLQEFKGIFVFLQPISMFESEGKLRSGAVPYWLLFDKIWQFETSI